MFKNALSKVADEYYICNHIHFRYYGKGSITNDNYIQFIRHDTLGFEYIEQSKNFVAQVKCSIIDDKLMERPKRTSKNMVKYPTANEL